MNWLREALKKGPIVSDGAMGTMLFRSGMLPGECSEHWNVKRPEVVASIHRQYVESGSMLLTTNTFGASPLALERHGLSGLAEEINKRGVEIAKEVACGKARVMASIGPFGGFLEPVGETPVEDLRSALRHQISWFLDAGADAVEIETMVDPNELELAVEVARAQADWPIIATFAFKKTPSGFRTIMGTTVSEAMTAAIGAGADAVGANCGTALDLDDYLVLALECLRAAQGHIVAVQPNAGAPRMTESGAVYSVTPGDMADWALRAIEAGVSVIGGCCGTTPEHLKAMAKVVKQIQ